MSSQSTHAATAGNVIPFPAAGPSRHGTAADAPRLGAQVAAMVASFGQLQGQALGLQEHTAGMEREAANAAAAVRRVAEALKSFDPADLLRGVAVAERRAHG